MSKSLTISTQVTSGSDVRAGEETLTGGKLVRVQESVAAASSATLAVAIDVSALKAIYLICDREMSFEFSGPENAFMLDANKPFSWHANSNLANPFGSTDVTSILCENEENAVAVVELLVLTDPTP